MKLRTLLLTLLVLICLCSCEIADIEDLDKAVPDYNKNADLFTLNQNGELILVQGAVVEGDIVIPLKLTVGGEEKVVTTLSDNLFSDCTSMTSLHVSGMVKTVQGGVLEGCTALKTLILDDGVQDVSFNATYGCDSLNLIWSLSLNEDVLVDASNIRDHENISLRGRIRLYGWN